MPRIAAPKPKANVGDNVPIELQNRPATAPVPNGAAGAPAVPVPFEKILAAAKTASLGMAIQLFLQIRAKRDAHNRVKKEASKQMDEVAAVIIGKMNKAGEGEELPADIKAMLTELEDPDGDKIQGFRVGDHVVYRYTLKTWSVPDVETFRHYIMNADPPQFDLVNFTPSYEACNAFLEKYEEPPDGAQQNKFLKLGVKKA